jgi:hypothetical protein
VFSLSKFPFHGKYLEFLKLTSEVVNAFEEVAVTNPSECFHFLCNIKLNATKFSHLSKTFQDFFANAQYKLRHDLVVSSIWKCLSLPFCEEKRIGDLFPALIDKTFASKTPDIIVINDILVRIFEITVSVTANEAARHKHDKYKDIAEAIRSEMKLKVDFIVIAITPDFNGLAKCLNDNFPDNPDNSAHALEAAALCTALQSNLDVAKPFFVALKKGVVRDHEAGRLRYIEELSVSLNAEAQKLEQDVADATLNPPLYRSVLDELFQGDDIVAVEDIPPKFAKQTPSHCNIQNILKVGREIPEEIAANYDVLTEPAPSLHFVIPVGELVYPPATHTISEEAQILDLCDTIYTCGIGQSMDPAICFLQTVVIKIMKIKYNQAAENIFKTGFPDEDSRKICKAYKSEQERVYIEKKIEKNPSAYSNVKYSYRVLPDDERAAYLKFREEQAKQDAESRDKSNKEERRRYNNYMSFSRAKLLTCTQPKTVTSLTLHHKSIRISEHYSNARVFFEQAHIGLKKMLKQKPDFDTTFKSKSLIPHPQDHAATQDLLYDWSNPSTENHIPAPDFLFTSASCPDNPTIMNLKEDIHKESTPVLQRILGTKWAEYSYRSHLFAQQLIHFGSLSNRKKTFYLCTTGLKNVCCLVAGTTHKPSTDPGVPFLFFGTIPKDAVLSPLFGKVHFFQPFNKPYKIFISNWRRLKLEKLTHMRDVFFSTLASSFKNLCVPETINSHDIVETFGIRNLVGLSVSQKVAEFMADFKYICMASLSEFSKTDVLIHDKIKGPFTKHLEIYLLFQLLRKSLETINSLILNPVVINEYHEDPDQEKEVDFSIGGRLALPYLWASEGIHEELNAYLDSVHTYVHTVKEPASNYHESIKSLKTILKFNNKYTNMTPDQRKGSHKTIASLEALLDDNSMGFDARFLSDAMKHFLSTNTIDYKRLLTSNVFFAPIAQFAGTKSSISDPRREEKSTSRMKVIDALIIDTLVKDDAFDIANNLIEHAAMVVNRPELKPLADMCIKVQYGPKREFYVLDVYFKFALKFMEEFFKQVCKLLPTECISVPGDAKLLKIQEINKKTRQMAHKQKKPHFFINGDCSKWSASELMESFAVIVFEMKRLLPKSVYNIFMNILSLWQQKRLQIEPKLVDKLGKTKLSENLFKEDNTPLYHLTLPQNFLMGLFNYLSSFKAVVVFEFTKHLITVRVPQVTFKYLAHSDDYTATLICTKKQLEAAKTAVTTCMRLGSITDSDKKTVVSNWYQEFVSLFTFNGVMTYPQIKKTKEVTSAITGMGYYQDASAIGSRVAEVIRVGCSNQAGLIFLKIHNWLLQNLYSLSKGQVNDVYRQNHISPFTLPTQAFGLTECWPTVYLLADGDPNNYRLSRYFKNQRVLIELASRGKDDLDSPAEGSVALYNPNFLKTFTSFRLKKVKKLIDYNHEDAVKFWEDHPAYKFLKPKYAAYLLPYLKAFFALKSFTLAYSRQSKLAIILRISSFVRKPCIGYKNELNLYTIKGLCEKFTLILNSFGPNDKSYIDPRFLTEGSIAPILFDRLLENSHPKIGDRDPSQYRSVASKMPKPYEQIHIDNNPADVIQYVYNKEDYIRDERVPLPNSNIEADADVVRRMDAKLTFLTPSEKISFIYACLTKDKRKLRICIGPSTTQPDLIRFIVGSFRHAFLARKACHIEIDHEIRFDGPLGMTPLRFVYGNRHITKVHVICKTLITLAIYIKLKIEDNKNPFTAITQQFTKLQIVDENKSAYEFLNTLSLKQMEVNCLSESETQSILFLQKTVCQRTDQLDMYGLQYSSILYKYEKSAQFTQDGYKGDSIIGFSCFDANNRMLHIDSINSNILISNAPSVSKLMMLFNVGTKFVDKKEFTSWESDKILQKLADNYIHRDQLVDILESYLGKTFFLNAARQKWEILCKDSQGLYLRAINRLNFNRINGIILPVIFNPCLMSGSLEDAKQHIMSNSYYIDETKWAIKTKSGDWTIAKFTIQDMYTNKAIFTNSQDFHFQNLNWDFLIKDCRLSDLYFKSDTPLEDDPNRLLAAIHKEGLPDIEIKNLFKLNDLTRKVMSFVKYYPMSTEILHNMDFPKMKPKENVEPVLSYKIEQSEASKAAIGTVAYKTREDLREILPELEAAVNDPGFILDADRAVEYKKHLEELKQGAKVTYSLFAQALINDDNDDVVDDYAFEQLRPRTTEPAFIVEPEYSPQKDKPIIEDWDPDKEDIIQTFTQPEEPPTLGIPLSKLTDLFSSQLPQAPNPIKSETPSATVKPSADPTISDEDEFYDYDAEESEYESSESDNSPEENYFGGFFTGSKKKKKSDSGSGSQSEPEDSTDSEDYPMTLPLAGVPKIQPQHISLESLNVETLLKAGDKTSSQPFMPLSKKPDSSEETESEESDESSEHDVSTTPKSVELFSAEEIAQGFSGVVMSDPMPIKADPIQPEEKISSSRQPLDFSLVGLNMPSAFGKLTKVDEAIEAEDEDPPKIDERNYWKEEYQIVREEIDEALEAFWETRAERIAEQQKIYHEKRKREVARDNTSDLYKDNVARVKLMTEKMEFCAATNNFKLLETFSAARSNAQKVVDDIEAGMKLPHMITWTEKRKIAKIEKFIERKLNKLDSISEEIESLTTKFKIADCDAQTAIQEAIVQAENKFSGEEALVIDSLTEKARILSEVLSYKPRRSLSQHRLCCGLPAFLSDLREKKRALEEKVEEIEFDFEEQDEELRAARIQSLTNLIKGIIFTISARTAECDKILGCTTYFEDDLPYFDRRTIFAEEKPEFAEKLKRCSEMEQEFLAAPHKLKESAQNVKKFLENPSTKFPNHEEFDLLFTYIDKVPEDEDLGIVVDYDVETVRFNEALNTVYDFAESLTNDLRCLITLKEFNFTPKGFTKTNKDTIDRLNKMYFGENSQEIKDTILSKIAIVAKSTLINAAQPYYQESLHATILAYLQTNLPGAGMFADLAALEERKYTKRIFNNTVTPFHSSTNQQYITHLRGLTFTFPDAKKWIDQLENEFEALPKNPAANAIQAALQKKEALQKKYEQLNQEMEDTYNSMQHIQENMSTDPDVRETIEKYNAGKTEANNLRRIKASELYSEIQQVDRELSVHKDLLNPVIDEISSFLMRGLGDNLLIADIDKSAVKQDLSHVKLHSAYNMKPKTSGESFKFLTKTINNKTKAWEDAVRQLNLIGMRSTIGYKILTLIFLHLSITRFSHLKDLDKFEKHVWNETANLLENCTFRKHVECFPENAGLAVVLEPTQEFKIYKYRLSDNFQGRKNELNLGSHKLKNVCAWELPKGLCVEDEIERYIQDWSIDQLKDSIDIGKQNLMLKLMHKLAQFPRDDDM